MHPDSLQTLDGLAPLDLFGLVLVAVLVLLGLWRGLWWQVIRLLGLALAVALARVFSPEVSHWISESWPEVQPRAAHGVAWAATFLLTLGAASIFGIMGQRILEVMQLGLANRIGGALVGGATGVLVHLAILVVLCQLAPESFLTTHVSGTVSERLVEATGSRWRVVMGAEAAGEVERALGREPGAPPTAPGDGSSAPPPLVDDTVPEDRERPEPGVMAIDDARPRVR